MWPVEFTGYRLLAHDHGGYAIVSYRVAKKFDGTPPRLSVTFDGIIHEYPDREALVIVKTSRGFGEMRSKSQNRLPINATVTTQQVALKEESVLGNVAGAVTAATIRTKRLVRWPYQRRAELSPRRDGPTHQPLANGRTGEASTLVHVRGLWR